MTTVRIGTNPGYDIEIGSKLLETAGESIKHVAMPCNAALITDDTVNGLYGSMVEKSLTEADFRVRRFVFPHGETSKTLKTLSDILEFLGENRFTRSDIVVALGGGVTGDMAGFAASVYARGIRFIQIPTTLLAAVDSSVGGKTAVNLHAGKNMAGAFYQPAHVLCDTDVMQALPANLRQDGAAEIIKHGVLADEKLFALAERGALFDDIEEVIARNVSIKREYVLADEFDEGHRQLLNLGHTLGHAIEKCSGFTLSHGKAVAIGMALIARASEKLGHAAEPISSRISAALTASGLPTASPYPAANLLEAAQLDKKRRGGSITLVVPIRIGECRLMRVPVESLGDWV